MAPLIARQGGEVGRAPFMVVAGRQSEVGTRRGVLVDEPKPKDKPPSLFTAGLVLLSPEPFLACGHRSPVRWFSGTAGLNLRGVVLVGCW